MHITLVHIQVKPAHIDDFIAATRLNHEASIQEFGNCRFDVLQSPENPDHFILYEAYVNAEAATAHKQTAHYLTWRDTVAAWMAEARYGTLTKASFRKDKTLCNLPLSQSRVYHALAMAAAVSTQSRRWQRSMDIQPCW